MSWSPAVGIKSTEIRGVNFPLPCLFLIAEHPVKLAGGGGSWGRQDIMGAQQTQRLPPMLFLFVGLKTVTQITMVWELKS